MVLIHYKKFPMDRNYNVVEGTGAREPRGREALEVALVSYIGLYRDKFG